MGAFNLELKVLEAPWLKKAVFENIANERNRFCL
jgi:hypothetical protein